MARDDAGRALTMRDVARVAADARARTPPDRPAPPEVRAELEQLETTRRFTRAAAAAFQQLLAEMGVRTQRPIALPLGDRPYWARAADPLAGYRSAPTLPAEVDVVVIGAGLTGASAAYHLAGAVEQEKWRVLVLDRGDPAGEASGRNGGNFETIPENSLGLYEGLGRERYHFLRRCYPLLPLEVVSAEAERQASLVLGLALRNRQRFWEIVATEGIDCDFSPRGWLFLAHTEQQEQGLCEEATLTARAGGRVEIWSRGKIRAEFGIDTPYLGRFVPGDGTYHPFKFVCGVLARAVERGVQLHTRTPVRQIRSLDAEHHEVVTDEGVVLARCVVVATNAFTRDLFPELAAIRPRQSQIMVTEHAPDRLRGRLVTSDDGPVYFNQPRAGAKNGRAPLLLGGGADRATAGPASTRRSPEVHTRLLALRDRYFPELAGQPPSTEWVGTMGFTPDQLPAIGFLRPGVIIAFACNGYGGSYTTAAGEAAAELARTGRTPPWLPEDVFSPRRLLSGGEPLFFGDEDGMWRVALALSSRLRASNAETADDMLAAAASATRAATTRERRRRRASPGAVRSVALTPADLASLPALARFDESERSGLIGLGRALLVDDEAVLFEQGDPGGSCFLVVRGAVDVTLTVGRRTALLATVRPGGTLGQVSLFDDDPRSATCAGRGETVVLELERDRVHAVLAGRGPLARKLLGLLTDDLITALRHADRRRLRLIAPDAGGRGSLALA